MATNGDIRRPQYGSFISQVMYQILDREWHSCEEIGKALEDTITPEQATKAFLYRHKSGTINGVEVDKGAMVRMGRTYRVADAIRQASTDKAWGHGKKAEYSPGPLFRMIETSGNGADTKVRLIGWYCHNCGLGGQKAPLCPKCASLLCGNQIDIVSADRKPRKVNKESA